MGIRSYFGSHLEKVSQSKKEQDFQKNSWRMCQCSGSSQIPSHDFHNDYHHFLSLYKVMRNGHTTELHIYNTKNKQVEVKSLDAKIFLNINTSITQLPNGELFCYGKGIALIIDRNYEVRMLPYGNSCLLTQALYYNNNIYCFGGYNDDNGKIDLSRKFDLEKIRWIDLASLPEADYNCNSVIFDGNILISGHQSRNLKLYSVEIDSFSIIPYEFASMKMKLLIFIESLHLIEWDSIGFIYESIDGYDWNKISKSGQLIEGSQMYCLYNKEKIYISGGYYYYQFDLKEKVLSRLKV